MRTPIKDFKSAGTTSAENFRCNDCNVSFTSNSYLLKHLLHHIKQPSILLKRVPNPPIRLTLKSDKDNQFVVVNSPSTTATVESDLVQDNNISGTQCKELDIQKVKDELEPPCIGFSKGVARGAQMTAHSVCTEVPGAQPTPPPESPPTEYPKIRIRSSEFLKNSVKITEICDEPPSDKNIRSSLSWSSGSIINSKPNDNANIISNLLNNNQDQMHNYDITTESEFMSLDRLDERNRNKALQLYNPSASTSTSSALDSITNLPMQQLANQVSRLPPPPNGVMHQQNVLINIQQFPQNPSQTHPPYQHPNMYPPHPPAPPMYQPYPFQPNPMYYPPTPNYPLQPRMPPSHGPPRPPPQQQMPQGNPQMRPIPQQVPPPHHQQFRQPAPPRQFNQQPRVPHQRAMVPPRPKAPVAPMQRAPGPRPRSNIINAPNIRGPRCKTMNQPSSVQNNNNATTTNNAHGQRSVKRSSEQTSTAALKKKRIDVLVPDQNDDADCEVIAVQPRNKDGDLPQIQSVQGGTIDPNDANIMHLSDSITLSVRNPPPKPQSPKKSDAKVVANILATRGITVTATQKPKEKQPTNKEALAPPTVAINLNSAVSIIPTAKPNTSISKTDPNNKLTTVDLTDDGTEDPLQIKSVKPPTITPQRNRRLRFRCTICTLQYSSSLALMKHRQMMHKNNSSVQLGIPLIDFKTPGVAQKLSNLGITSFIPLANATSDGQFGLPVVSYDYFKNTFSGDIKSLEATSILSLGPVKTLNRSASVNVGNKKS